NDSSTQKALAEIAVQFAGDLAFQKATDADTKKGIFELTDGDKKLKADLDPQKWVNTFNIGSAPGADGASQPRTGGQEKIVGLDQLVTALIAAAVAGDPARKIAIEQAALRLKVDAGTDYRNVTWLEAAATTAGVTIAAPENAKPTKPGTNGQVADIPGGAILIGGAGKDVITGSKGHDLILGGDGDDTFAFSAGNDLYFGGKNNDTYLAGDGTLPAGIDGRGSATFFGGAGIKDTADYSRLDQAVDIWRPRTCGTRAQASVAVSA
ncbi:MAG: hypothetical protein ABL907_20600, partial [Hyphomicrobium sp.]